MTSDVGISQDGHKGSAISKQQSWGRTGCLQAAAAHVARWRGDQHRTLLCRCQMETTTEMVLVSEEFSEIFVFKSRSCPSLRPLGLSLGFGAVHFGNDEQGT